MRKRRDFYFWFYLKFSSDLRRRKKRRGRDGARPSTRKEARAKAPRYPRWDVASAGPTVKNGGSGSPALPRTDGSGSRPYLK